MYILKHYNFSEIIVYLQTRVCGLYYTIVNCVGSQCRDILPATFHELTDFIEKIDSAQQNLPAESSSELSSILLIHGC